MPTEIRNGILFYWNDDKFKLVYDGRKIEFDEVISVFDDPFMVTGIDDRFDYEELRMVSVGMSNKGRLLAIAWFKPSQKQVKGYNNGK